MPSTRPFAGRRSGRSGRATAGRRAAARVALALAAIAATAAVPSLGDNAQRLAARVADAVQPAPPAFEPPPLPDVEALMSGDPVVLATLDTADIVPPSASATLVPARPFPRAPSALDRARAQQCLTTAIYYEAASEPTAGQRAVAQVVLNRVAHPAFPGTVCDVVYQGSERWTGCQFSFTCDGSLARMPERGAWSAASAVAADALAGRVFAPVGLATHYHTWRVWPSWGRTLVSTATVGAHIFHRLRGYWGTAAAFRQSYRGGEPMPGPHLRLGPPPSPVELAAATGLAPPPPGDAAVTAAPAAPIAATPMPGRSAPLPPIATVAGARSALAGRPATTGAAAKAPADPTSQLPSSTIRSEYAGSGQWKDGAGR